jgi:glycosyltransferase involved in cell wall biosynthesis
VGENNKKYFLKYGLKDKNLVFAPHTIDNKRFSDPLGIYENKAMQWRKDLGFSENHLVFLYAGKFEPKKNPALFIDAASQLRNENLKFVIAGDGILKENLMELAENNPNIIFIPFQNQSLMPVLYRLCHVFVMPSKGPGETWGLAVNEAMACQKAILVSDKTGCAADLVKDNFNGYIFKSEDIVDFIDKLSRFNHQNCIEFGKNSFRMIQDYSFENLSYSIENKIQPGFGNQ